MQTANDNGCYEAESREELARKERSYAVVKLCQCNDGLFRYALDVTYSYGGFGGPISDYCEGHPTYKAALDVGAEELLRRFPAPWKNHPKSVHDELAEMKAQVRQRVIQPSLF